MKRDTIMIDWGSEADLETLAARVKENPKINAANSLAHYIVFVFGAALLIILTCGVVLVIRRPPAESEQIIMKCFMPFLQGVGSFWSTIFGPPLWMILGYYFGASVKRGPASAREHTAA